MKRESNKIEKQARKKAVWITVIVIILVILALAAILPGWNEMWHEFGRSLYYFFNS